MSVLEICLILVCSTPLLAMIAIFVRDGVAWLYRRWLERTERHRDPICVGDVWTLDGWGEVEVTSATPSLIGYRQTATNRWGQRTMVGTCWFMAPGEFRASARLLRRRALYVVEGGER